MKFGVETEGAKGFHNGFHCESGSFIDMARHYDETIITKDNGETKRGGDRTKDVHPQSGIIGRVFNASGAFTGVLMHFALSWTKKVLEELTCGVGKKTGEEKPIFAFEVSGKLTGVLGF
jgi:hypothetical protein